MPRKTSNGGKPVNAVGAELKAVRLELTPEIHKELRIEAAKQDLSMAALVRGWVEENLALLRKRKGGGD
jgi:predicted HicB family RNase H-like nuclease